MLVGFLSITAFSQINVTSLDGSSVALDAQKGKVVILAIGASWVPLSTEQIAAANALKKKYAGKNVVMLMYPGEGHGLSKKENQVDYHRRINQWFDHYLKGNPPAKWIVEGQSALDRKAILDANK